MDVYEIVKTIGSGSFGQVYQARHTRENKHYVIKRVKTRDMSQKDLENTENEVRLLQKIRHTNIVAYKDSYVDREQYLNIVMIYCDGGDIYTKIKNAKGKNFPENLILDWLVQMALALLYLHERKILHRDMKTQNIFLKNGKIRLGDFGIAKVLDSTRDFANTCIGTPYYMSPELFKNQPYSYKSDVWALGCVLYEMCNLRHAFDAQSIHGLSVKILRGSFPPINNMYSKQLRDLIGKMLQVKPKSRPTILDILNKVFVRKRAAHYFNECLNNPPPVLGPMDVDDMYVDSLKDQAEKLMIPGFGSDNSQASRLSRGSSSVQGVNAKKRKSGAGEGRGGSKSPEKRVQGKPLKSAQEKTRELLKLKHELSEKEEMEVKLKNLVEEANSKEEQYKEKYQKAQNRRNDMIQAKQDRAIRASNPYAGNQRPGGARSSANRSSSVPAITKQQNQPPTVNSSLQGLSEYRDPVNKDNAEGRAPRHSKPGRGRQDRSMDVESTEAVKEKKARGRQHASSVHNEDEGDVNLLPPRGEGSQGRVGSLVKGESQEPSLLKNSRNNGNVSSQKSFGTDGPLNTYAEFKNVFNAKGVGTKTHRRQAQQAQNSLQDQQSKKNQQFTNASSHSVNNQEMMGQNDQPMSARDRQLHNREQQQNQMARERDMIMQANINQRKDANKQNYNQYRSSYDQTLSKSGSNLSLGSNDAREQYAQELVNMGGAQSPALGSIQPSQKKKIEENFQLFEDDEVNEDDGGLDDIIEEVIEEESDDDEDFDDPNGDAALASQEIKDQKRIDREELKNLRTQMLTLKKQVDSKTNNIETIRTNLKQSQVRMKMPAGDGLNFQEQEDNIIDQTVREMEDFQLEGDETAPTGDSAEENDQDDDMEYETGNQSMRMQILNQDDSGDEEDEQMMHTDPQVLKLTDKIRLYKHRCVASLGYNLYEKAFDFLKQVAEQGGGTQEKRQGLIAILGEESIGFWAILDQILFYEDLVKELQIDSQRQEF